MARGSLLKVSSTLSMPSRVSPPIEDVVADDLRSGPVVVRAASCFMRFDDSGVCICHQEIDHIPAIHGR